MKNNFEKKTSYNKKDSIFIIGSGPSLNICNINILKRHNTFSMNRQYISYEEWGFSPTYYGCIDRRLLPTIADDIGRMIDDNLKSRPFPIKNFFLDGDFATKTWGATSIDAGVLLPNTYSRILREEEMKKLKTYVNGKGRIRENNVYKSALRINSSHTDSTTPSLLLPETINQDCWSNCGVFCANMAAAIGYKNIYLLGMDITYYGDESRDHYSPKYFDPERFDIGSTHGGISSVTDTIGVWKEFKNTISSRNNYLQAPNIISCTPNSPINEIFPYEALAEVMGVSQE